MDGKMQKKRFKDAKGFAIGCSNEEIYGPIAGTIFAVLLIISLGLLEIILDILYLIDCVTLIKNIR